VRDYQSSSVQNSESGLMRFVLFYHSLVSDWNHGNAHFLRGIVTELQSRGHEVAVYEPHDGWSFQNLIEDRGTAPLDDFERVYQGLSSQFYDLEELDLDAALDEADVVIVHEWNDPLLIQRIGEHRANGGRYRLLFHDTHHRFVTDAGATSAYDLSHYDGVLAFGRILRDLYLKERRVERAWTWHEAADVRRFAPQAGVERTGDLVWIGNWGDDERTGELNDFLLEPVRRLGLQARVYGVRYPQAGRRALAQAGIEYAGWLPNFQVPEVFAQFHATIHIPRRPYRESLPGIPTIRVFEALACGIPLVCVHWEDIDHLFEPGRDYLVAQTGAEMTDHLRMILHDRDFAGELAEHGRNTILARHTCQHRVDELLGICEELGIVEEDHRAVRPGLC
jgi:spore maturation protein CgeB